MSCENNQVSTGQKQLLRAGCGVWQQRNSFSLLLGMSTGPVHENQYRDKSTIVKPFVDQFTPVSLAKDERTTN